MTINKTINTTVLEQVKSATIIILVVSITAFILGVQYQKRAIVQVQNSVIVQSTETTPEVKK